ncbi:signal peptide protein [Burkholderiaceae bacterium 16]|nr:signal peptide protein [Burkholderiaceae bacterium 16]
MKYPLAGLALASLLLVSPWAGAAPKDGAADKLAPMLESLEIGSPMPTLPDCADKRTPDGRDVTALCVEVRGDGVMRQVGVPRDKRPPFMDGPHVVAFVDRNALVGLIVPTDGVRSEKTAVDSLTARYGKPFRSEQVEMKDKAGQPVKSTHAGWMRKPLTVELYAIPDDPNNGTIEMLLPQARVLMADQDKAMAQQLNPNAASAAQAAPASKAEAKKGKDGKW